MGKPRKIGTIFKKERRDAHWGITQTDYAEVIAIPKMDDEMQEALFAFEANQGVLTQLYNYIDHAVAKHKKVHERLWNLLKSRHPEVEDWVDDINFDHKSYELVRILKDEEELAAMKKLKEKD